MGKKSYLEMRSDQEALNLISSDWKDFTFAARKLANHAIKLGGLGFGTTFLQWVAAVAAIYLLILDRTNWRTNILTGLLIPYIFFSLPSLVFNVFRGEVGKWIALIAVVLRLYFPRHFPDWLEMPAALILLIVVAPALFASTVRNSWIGVAICLVIACYLLQEHIRASGGFRNAFTKAHGVSNTVGIVLLFVYPAWALIEHFWLFTICVERAWEEYRNAARRVELPAFHGDDPFAWVTRTESYFMIHEIPPELRLPMVQICMEGGTLYWFMNLRELDPRLTWERFKRSLFERYGGKDDGDPIEQLKSVCQRGSVDECIDEFEKVASQIGRFPDEWYMSCFMGGLCEEVKNRVRTHDPPTWVRLISVARKVERELIGEGVVRLGEGRRKTEGFHSNPGHRMGQPNMFRPAQTHHAVGNIKNEVNESDHKQKGPISDNHRTGNAKWRGTRNLSYDQLMERRAKGLCFKCGQTFGPLHRCLDKELRLIIWEDDEDVVEESKQGKSVDEGQQEEWKLVCNFMELMEWGSDQSSPPKLMVFIGKLNELPIAIMVDSGANHNLVSRRWVQAMGINVTPTKTFGVRLGNGCRSLSQGLCKGIQLELNEEKFRVNAYVFDIGGLDLILGMAWLETLGVVNVDWKNMCMTFDRRGTAITLQGTNMHTRNSWSSFSVRGFKVESDTANQSCSPVDGLKAEDTAWEGNGILNQNQYASWDATAAASKVAVIHLEDKVPFEEEGIVSTLPSYTQLQGHNGEGNKYKCHIG